MDTERFEKGYRLRAALDGKTGPVPHMEDLDPMSQMIAGHVFGEIYSRENLSMRERLIVTVVTILAIGGADKPLRSHMIRAMKNGITRQELEEICLHASVYCGYPRAVTAKQILDSIGEEEYQKTQEEPV